MDLWKDFISQSRSCPAGVDAAASFHGNQFNDKSLNTKCIEANLNYILGEEDRPFSAIQPAFWTLQQFLGSFVTLYIFILGGTYQLYTK